LVKVSYKKTKKFDTFVSSKKDRKEYYIVLQISWNLCSQSLKSVKNDAFNVNISLTNIIESLVCTTLSLRHLTKYLKTLPFILENGEDLNLDC